MYTHALLPIHCILYTTLGMAVSKELVHLAIMKPGHLIDEEDIEVKPESIVDGVMDENIDISLICQYFTPDAWMLIQDVII